MTDEKKTFEFDEKVAAQLNRLFRTDSLKKLRQDYFKLLNVQPGEHILDVGCGSGANATALVEYMKGNCRITGIDSSEPMLAIGHKNLSEHHYGKSIELQHGDAHQLPFEDASFDAAMIIQVLEYSKEPLRMLGETKRVLKPRGRIFVADTDWDTIVWNSNQKDKTRRIVLEWSDHEADGWQGRKIHEYLKRAEFENIRGGIFTMSEASFAPDGYAALLTEIIADYLARSEKIPATELQDWIEDLKRKDRDGHFYFSLNRYAFLGERPATS